MNINQFIIKSVFLLSLSVLCFIAGILYKSQSNLDVIDQKVYQKDKQATVQVVSQWTKDSIESSSSTIESSVERSHLNKQRVTQKRLSDREVLQALMATPFDLDSFGEKELETLNTLASIAKDDPAKRKAIIADIVNRIDTSYEEDETDHLYYLLRYFKSEESDQKIASHALDLIQSGVEVHRRLMAYEMLSGNPAVNSVEALEIALSIENDPEIIEVAISHIGAAMSYSSKDKARILAIYDGLYTSTTEPSIREIALDKLSDIANTDVVQKHIDSALNGSEGLIRSRALAIIRERKDLHTDINKQKLFSLATNDSVSENELKDVYFALSSNGFDLDDKEYRQLLLLEKKLNIRY